MNDNSEDHRSLLTAVLGISLWTAGELFARRTLGPRLAQITDDDLAGDMLISLATVPLLAWLIGGIGKQMGLRRERWEYHWTPRAIGGGIVAGVAGLVSLGVTTRIDSALFGGLDDTEVVEDDTSAVATILLIVVNGVVVPIAEEFVWRGVVQTALVERFDATVGISLTSIAFALKHVVVDRSLNRLTMLLALGSIFGIVRHWLGTSASTTAHITGNLPASLLAIVIARLE